MLAAAVLAASAAWTTPAAGQELKGRVVERGSGSSVAGALAKLVDDGGAEVASTLTGPDGAYSLTAPAPGTYRLRVERIGYSSWTSGPLTLETGETRSFRPEIPVKAVQLGELRVTADDPSDRCRSSPGEGLASGRLWEEARKAVEATRQTQDELRVRFELRRWHRVIGEDGRVRDETSRVRAGRAVRPFYGLPADDLAQNGYVREAERGKTWYAPDARALLSGAFQRQHCFWVRTSAAPDGWIGLAFEPVRGREVPDIEGVLWMDRSTLELRRLDYSYVNVDIPDEARDVGGRIEFQRLPTGTWIVRDWRIRMPRVGLDQYHDEVTAGYEVDGGEVVAAYDSDGERLDLARRATLLGRVRYGGSGGPADGARVALRGTDHVTRTDSLGRFRFDMVPAGKYAVELHPPDLGDLGVRIPGPPVDLDEGESREVELSLPDWRSLAARVCPGSGPEAGVAVVGRVRDPDGDDVAGAQVRANWRGAFDSRGSGREVSSPRLSVATAADSSGRYVMCDVAPGARLSLRASAPGLEPAEARLDLPEEGVVRRDLELATRRVAAGRSGPGSPAAEANDPGGTGAVWGRVVDGRTRKPLAGAEVVAADGRARAVTDSAGRFRLEGLPAGDVPMRIRFLGYDSRARTVPVPRGDTLRPTIELETAPIDVADLEVKVEGTEVSARMSGFWQRKDQGMGEYITRDRLEETPGSELHRVLRSVPGLQVRPCPGTYRIPDCYRVETSRRQGFLQSSGCEVTYWIDGNPVRVDPQQGVNFVPTEDIEAVEVYSGPGQVPPQFSGVGRTCGAVVIWTRSPGDETEG